MKGVPTTVSSVVSTCPFSDFGRALCYKVCVSKWFSLVLYFLVSCFFKVVAIASVLHVVAIARNVFFSGGLVLCYPVICLCLLMLNTRFLVVSFCPVNPCFGCGWFWYRQSRVYYLNIIIFFFRYLSRWLANFQRELLFFKYSKKTMDWCEGMYLFEILTVANVTFSAANSLVTFFLLLF